MVNDQVNDGPSVLRDTFAYYNEPGLKITFIILLSSYSQWSKHSGLNHQRKGEKLEILSSLQRNVIKQKIPNQHSCDQEINAEFTTNR